MIYPGTQPILTIKRVKNPNTDILSTMRHTKILSLNIKFIFYKPINKPTLLIVQNSFVYFLYLMWRIWWSMIRSNTRWCWISLWIRRILCWARRTLGWTRWSTLLSWIWSRTLTRWWIRWLTTWCILLKRKKKVKFNFTGYENIKYQKKIYLQSPPLI